jgi:hypothetical protein
MDALEGALADAVVGQWAARVAIGRAARTCSPRLSWTSRHLFLYARLRWVRNRLFAEPAHQDNTDVYPAAPGVRRFVKVVDDGFNRFGLESEYQWSSRLSFSCPKQ